MVTLLTFQHTVLFKFCLVIFRTLRLQLSSHFSYSYATNTDQTFDAMMVIFVTMLVNVVTMPVNVVTMFLGEKYKNDDRMLSDKTYIVKMYTFVMH